MENKNTVIDAKIGNLNELTKVLSVKEQAQEQLLAVMKALGKTSPDSPHCDNRIWKLSQRKNDPLIFAE